MNINDQVSILIEISSGRDLMVGDVTTSDPYIVACLGTKEIHRTKHIRKTLNPVWGPKEDNTFVLDCSVAKFTDADGIWFVVRDFDMVSADDALGQLRVKADDLLVEPGGEPRTFERKVNAPKGKAGTDCGYLTIRCRHATPDDVASIQKGEKKSYF